MTTTLLAAGTPGFLKAIAKIFEPLVKLLHWVLVNLHDGIAHLGLTGAAWGLAIIALTIIVRLIIMPLTFKQFRSAQAMGALQPHIKELQRKHKGDKARLQQETMRLYRENKVNPFASCLPMLLQIPIFISLYWTIKGTGYLDKATTLALNDSSFLWLKHLGQPDHTYILLIIYVVSQLISTELMMTPQTEKQQKMIMRAMPVVFIFILKNFPSGLFLYWVTTNLWTIGQQLIIRHSMPHNVAVANVKVPTAGSGAAAGKSSAAAAKPQGRFMRSLMAAQDERERQSRGQAKPGVRPAGKAKAKPGGAKPGGGKPSGKRPNKPSRKGPPRPDV